MPKKVVIGVVAAVATCVAASPAGAATITVTGTGDTIAADGSCVLREAITAANGNATSNECAAGQASPTVDTIAFSIAGSGPHVIAVGSSLPVITGSVVIDGDTDVNPGPGSDVIRIDAPVPGPFVALDVEADDSEVRDLVITRFPGAIDAGGTEGIKIEDNIIGTTPTGTAGLGGTTGIGGNELVDAEISDNVIASQSSHAISIDGDDVSGVDITGNLIGTNPAGTAGLNNGFGINIVGATQDVVIGGAGADGNVISGNDSGAITVQAGAAQMATGVRIEGNRIGTGIGGENAIPNSFGVRLFGPVQGAEIRDNLISGNDDYAIDLAGVADVALDDTVIAGNLIGTDKDGLEPLGNTGGAIAMGGGVTDHPVTDTVIGGTTGLTPGGACTGDCNVISDNGNTPFGTIIGGGPSDTSGTQILGNHIGADVAGTGALGNTGRAISLFDSLDTVIGAPGAGNAIADSAQDAILVEGDSRDLEIQSNLIGLGSDGTTPMGNGGFGINLRGNVLRAQIGGTIPGEANEIANTNNMAVRIEGDATDNPILGNSMHDNGFGIDLFPEPGPDLPTPNDPLDVDTGPNDVQNFPESLVASTIGGTTYVAGRMASRPDTSYRVEFFVADPSIDDFGEGETFLGATTVTTDEDGEVPFNAELPASAEDAAVTATATRIDPVGSLESTSEFSENTQEVDCDIEGTSGDDPALAGTAGDEVICGLEGDDVIDGGGGFDLIIGGDGTDEVDYSGAGGELSADLNGLVEESGGGDTVLIGVENLIGSDFDDTIVGSAVANFVQAGDGKDTIEGLDGDDELKGGIGGDTLNGGGGDDELLSQDGGDVLKGQSGRDDELSAGPGKDNLNGGGGNSDFCNGGGNSDDTPAPGCESTSSIP